MNLSDRAQVNSKTNSRRTAHTRHTSTHRNKYPLRQDLPPNQPISQSGSQSFDRTLKFVSSYNGEVATAAVNLIKL